MCIRDRPPAGLRGHRRATGLRRLQPGHPPGAQLTLLHSAQPEAAAGGARFRGGDRAGDEEPGASRPSVCRSRHLWPADYRDFGVSGPNVLAVRGGVDESFARARIDYPDVAYAEL